MGRFSLRTFHRFLIIAFYDWRYVVSFHQMAPTMELVDISQNIRRRVSKLEKRIVENERKSSDVLQEIDQLVNVQNLVHACLGGDDVSIWAELDRVRHIFK